MQKLSQARSELRSAAGSDKGIQKLQFLKVHRHGGRGRDGESLVTGCDLPPPRLSLCKLTRSAGKRLRKCDCDDDVDEGKKKYLVGYYYYYYSVSQTIKITISLSVMFSLGLAYFVPFTVIWPKIKSKFEDIKYAKIMFRFSGAIATTLVALAIPQLIPLLGLLTAISMTTIMLLVPVVIETATKWERATRFLLVKNISISVVWVLLMTLYAIFNVAQCRYVLKRLKFASNGIDKPCAQNYTFELVY
ncbi:hypothetical protein WH47_12865 [Habropoda laboriosa]|uniref:Amino acid transporter transmembrane domain-containing protein n=1 Tax=Habropoda laboriosa TaxID=597456 RepID=A0A0L7QKL6_9HYME|nr:hypothetical protein WH47_12865 [Habropoda laboriosa]